MALSAFSSRSPIVEHFISLRGLSFSSRFPIHGAPAAMSARNQSIMWVIHSRLTYRCVSDSKMPTSSTGLRGLAPQDGDGSPVSACTSAGRSATRRCRGPSPRSPASQASAARRRAPGSVPSDSRPPLPCGAGFMRTFPGSVPSDSRPPLLVSRQGFGPNPQTTKIDRVPLDLPWILPGHHPENDRRSICGEE